MYKGLASADPANLIEAVRIAQKILCLPIYPNLAQNDQQRVIAQISRNWRAREKSEQYLMESKGFTSVELKRLFQVGSHSLTALSD